MRTLDYMPGVTVAATLPTDDTGRAPAVVRVRIRLGWLRTTTIEIEVPRSMDGELPVRFTVPIQYGDDEPMRLRFEIPPLAH